MIEPGEPGSDGTVDRLSLSQCRLHYLNVSFTSLTSHGAGQRVPLTAGLVVTLRYLCLRYYVALCSRHRAMELGWGASHCGAMSIERVVSVSLVLRCIMFSPQSDGAGPGVPLAVGL